MHPQDIGWLGTAGSQHGPAPSLQALRPQAHHYLLVMTFVNKSMGLLPCQHPNHTTLTTWIATESAIAKSGTFQRKAGFIGTGVQHHRATYAAHSKKKTQATASHTWCYRCQTQFETVVGGGKHHVVVRLLRCPRQASELGEQHSLTQQPITSRLQQCEVSCTEAVCALVSHTPSDCSSNSMTH